MRSALIQLMTQVSTSATWNSVGTFGFLAPPSTQITAAIRQSPQSGWGAGRNVAVGPDGEPLRMDRRCVGLEEKELLLLLGIQPPLTTSLLWRLVEAAVLVGHIDGLTALSEPTRQTSGFLSKFDHVAQQHLPMSQSKSR